jgi:hypothetical protein
MSYQSKVGDYFFPEIFVINSISKFQDTHLQLNGGGSQLVIVGVVVVANITVITQLRNRKSFRKRREIHK